MTDIDLERPRDRRSVLRGIGALSVVGALSGATTPAAALARGRHHGRQASYERLLETYWVTLNAGMASPTGDFSGMADVYAADATLTQSNPAGVTNVSTGIDEIIAFYGKAYAKFHGYQWSLDSTRWLAWDIALNYEHAGSPPLTVPGRCAHLFTFCGGRIQTLDWVTFYGGAP